jgi:hypothetical protein
MLTQNRHRRNRRRAQLSTPPAESFATATVTKSVNDAVLDFDLPVAYTGILPLMTVATRNLISAAQTGPSQITITFDGTVATFDWEIQQNDPSMRTATGGFVKAACGTFP